MIKLSNNKINVYNSVQFRSPNCIPLQFQKDFYKFRIHLEYVKYSGFRVPATGKVFVCFKSATDASVRHFSLKCPKIIES